MRGSKRKSVWSIAIVGLAGWLGAEVAWCAAPATVSPGRTDEWTVVEGRCPSFSWTLLPEASAVELAVFALSPNADPSLSHLAEAELVLFERLPGAASSWTPSLDRCLQPGERYAWSVRSAQEREQGGALENAGGDASDSAGWSAPRFLEVSRGPSFQEVEAAINVLLRHRETESGESRSSDDRSSARGGLPNDRSRTERERATPPARAAQPASAVARLRVGGVISGDGSELTFDGSLGSDDLGTNSVGSDEIATGAVSTSEISGSEVAVFQVAPSCAGGSALTLAATCVTTLCATGPTTFLTCAGACTAPSQQVCPNTLVGLLLSTSL